ncbi:ankyrin repeat and death domain-containing protein [Anaeramoeba ignava]|uniref:Ankyrin repeat and death domain-containing protein n=1 Tax=Anaeramoeba ignava TaxID=1746090 RepID=A0A9Q0RFX1_ANAIG|nr:ankyrin repeat and death domain-containing protein [Anaeramoeba ignava]|eukprot:Anaeramoba_ignava/a621115_40.p1 GENE.a621115_40~~a621115_40.p1  ORF type:complete len:263 (-),score=87.07 a621115_40:18-806(-)
MLNFSDTFGEPPLIHAVKEQKLQNINYILKNGGKVNTKDSNGMTGLMHAVLLGNEDIVKELLSFKADPNIRDNKKMTASTLAGCFGKKQMIKILTENGDKTDPKEINGSLLIYYSKKGDLSQVQSLLSQEISVNFSDQKKWTALISASHYGKYGVVKELLNVKDIDLQAKNDLGGTALHHAAHQGHVEIVEELCSQNADINAQDFFGFTPLHYAKDIKVAEKMLKFKERIDFNIKNSNDLTAAEFHKSIDNEDIAKLILENI